MAGQPAGPPPGASGESCVVGSTTLPPPPDVTAPRTAEQQTQATSCDAAPTRACHTPQDAADGGMDRGAGAEAAAPAAPHQLQQPPAQRGAAHIPSAAGPAAEASLDPRLSGEPHSAAPSQGVSPGESAALRSLLTTHQDNCTVQLLAASGGWLGPTPCGAA